MFDLMYEREGVGLAATQVDLPFQLFVINPAGKRGEGEELVFINPVLSQPKGRANAEEGCLSLPSLYATVSRPERIRVVAYDLAGNQVDTILDDYLARIIQHEVDHLHGTLFIDRIPDLNLASLKSNLEEFEMEFRAKTKRRVDRLGQGDLEALGQIRTVLLLIAFQGKRMRLLAMGTGRFAVPTLEALVESTHELLALIAKPVVATDRKGRPVTSPMRRAAMALSVPIVESADVNADAFIERLRAFRADVAVVCDFGQILSPCCLAAMRCGGVNLHGSLLPKYRGAAPVQWAILSGEKVTGVSVIHMTPRLDAGPILTSRTTEISDNETAEELELRLSQLGVGAILDALSLLAIWDGESPIGTPQDQRLASRHHGFVSNKDRSTGTGQRRASAIKFALFSLGPEASRTGKSQGTSR